MIIQTFFLEEVLHLSFLNEINGDLQWLKLDNWECPNLNEDVKMELLDLK